MSVSPARDLILRPGYEAARRKLVQDIPRILGVTPVAGYLPHRDDRTTSTDPWTGGTWTADGDMAGQIFALGSGFYRAFVSASSRYLTRADTSTFSFGNGTTDQAFCVFALANVTDTANARMLVSKREAAANREYQYLVNATDQLQLSLTDESVPTTTSRISDAAITQGAWGLLSASYDGGGGATAANGIGQFANGASIASTATNSGTYVAMEDLAAALEIGSASAHTANFLDGGLAFLVLAKVNASAAQHAAVATALRLHFGLAS